MNIFKLVLPFGLAALLASCGGGGNGGGNTPTTPAPSALTYPAVPTLTLGVAMTAATPSVTGTVTSYSVSPALPAGLTLNTTSGAISGTPTSAAAATNYVVTAGNAGGNTTASVAITVNDLPPAITYPRSALLLTVNGPSPTVTPSNTGGTATQWSVAPGLPAGLVLNAASGVLSGTPTVLSPSTNYRVTATNSGGSANFDFAIVVLTDVLIDAGHTSPPTILRWSASRVVSVDFNQRWILWKYPEATMVASGHVSCPASCSFPNFDAPPGNQAAGLVELAGDTLMVRNTEGFELRNATDGSLLATIKTSFAWSALASDGSYACIGNSGQLQCWSRTGQLLGSRGAFFNTARALALPGVLKLGHSNESPTAIQLVDPVTGGTTAGASFFGEFFGWFTDGSHFLTRTDSAMRIYDLDGAELAAQPYTPFIQIVGQGNYYSRASSDTGNRLEIYRIGTAAPVYSTAQPIEWFNVGRFGLQIGFPTEPPSIGAAAPGTFTVIDLSGPNPVRNDSTRTFTRANTFAARSSTEYLVAHQGGIFDSQNPAPAIGAYGYGGITSLATSNTRIAVAVAAPRIFIYGAATREVEITLPVFATTVKLSRDGSVLAVRLGSRDVPSSLRLYSLPSATLLHEWQYPNTQQLRLVDFGLSENGAVISQLLLDESNTYLAETHPALGGPAIMHDQSVFITNANIASPPHIALSPSGAVASIQDGNYETATFSSVYENGIKLGTIPGAVVAWLDENTAVSRNKMTATTALYSKSGTLLSAAPNTFPSVFGLKRITNTTAYLPGSNSVVSLANWSTLMQGPQASPAIGGVTATDVVYADGAVVHVLPY